MLIRKYGDAVALSTHFNDIDDLMAVIKNVWNKISGFTGLNTEVIGQCIFFEQT